MKFFKHYYFFDVFVLTSILLLMLPFSLEAVVQQIGIDPHPLSFFIGPALYSYADGLIPNLDYFTQYGTGLGKVFFYFLNSSVEQTYQRAILFVILGTVFFGFTYYLLCQKVLESRIWAYGLVMITLLMNFFGPAPLRGPSCWPIRYPFLALFCFIFFSFCQNKGKVKKALFFFLSVVSGISFFWNTEIGLYTLIIGSFCVWHHFGFRLQLFIWALSFFLLSFFTFTLVCWLAFGTGIFSYFFAIALFKPALLYASGFGFWPVNWLSPWEYLFNVIVPILLSMTVISMFSANTYTATENRIENSSLLLLIALLASAQLLKYWNMGLAAVWVSNSYLPLLILVYWIKKGVTLLRLQPTRSRISRVILNGLPVVVLLLGLCYATLFRDERMDFQYGTRMYAYYPSLLMKMVGYTPATLPPTIPFSALDITANDINLIVKYVPQGKQAYIYSSRDWAYALLAKRAPGFPVIPVTETPLLEQGQGWQPFFKTNIVFLDIGPKLWNGNAALYDFILKTLQSDFVLEEKGEHLNVYRRKINKLL